VTRAPRVTVCTATYNRGPLLAQTIRSVLAQSYQDFELLIVDDCSTDDTAEVVAGFADHRIRYVRNPSNLGMYANRNRCLQLARGELIAQLDDDDLYLPDALSSLVAALDAAPTAGLVFGATLEIDRAGAVVDHRRTFPSSRFLAPWEAFQTFLVGRRQPPSAVLVRAACYREFGGFEPDNWCGDWDLWLRLSRCYPVVYIDQPVLRYRQAVDNSTLRAEQDGSAPLWMRRTVGRALAAPPAGLRLPAELACRARLAVARYELSVAFALLGQGEYGRFRRHVLAAITFAPELAGSRDALLGVVLSALSLIGPRGPALLWALRDYARGASASLARLRSRVALNSLVLL
jgi:glycosyltransferase involved in cell wall biosynthesis